MAEFNTFSGICIATCMFMIFFGMATAVVNAVAPNVFPGLAGIDTSNAESKIDTDYMSIGVIVVTYGAAIIGAGILAVLTNSTNIIGVWLFSAVFWASFLSLNGTLSIMLYGYLGAASIPIFAILWIGMIMMFIGAIIGMLSGSQWMR